MNKALTLLALLFFFESSAQVIETSVAEVDFELVDYGAPASIAIDVANLTNQVVQIEEVLFFDIYQSSPFHVSGVPTSIPANGMVQLQVVFDPIHNIEHNTEMIIKTSGNRGAVAVDLKGSCEYPNDYYDDTFNEMDTDLKEALNSILGAGYTSLGYNAARDEMYMEIDNQRLNGQGASQNRLTRAYLGTDAEGYTSRSDLFSNFDVNCEHTFPQGTFNQNEPMRSDIHHLFPTDEDANAERGSLRFGTVVSGVQWSGGGSQKGVNDLGQLVFEPRDAQKGASARAILYFLARYQNYSGHVNEVMETTLREWHSEFQPTDVDRQRNDDIFDRQDNRNPFVDYPQMADRIFSFRLDQDRPNVGELAMSHTSANFGEEVLDAADFNLVLANIGERFFTVSEVTVSGTGFSLAEGQNTNFVISNGESADLKVHFDPDLAPENSTGTLTFTTSLSSAPSVSIPLTVGTLGLSRMEEVGISLHPNPAVDSFRLAGLTDQIQSVKLIDMQGKEVLAFAKFAAFYPLQRVGEGMYLVVVSLENGSQSIGRLVVSR